jgi:hypothetical protein
MYYQKALQYKRAEDTLTTKRDELVRTNKENNSKEETDKENKKMNELISSEKLVDIFQEWIKPFIPENKGKGKCCFGIVSDKYYWRLNDKIITVQECYTDGTKIWKIYQNEYSHQPCLEIFPDHIRLHDESGYFEAFSVDSIRDLGHMIEKKCFEDKDVMYLDPLEKEENKMRIDLENVAVKVEHQNPNDYCVISIGRLNHSEKCRLLNVFPTAIDSLKCVSQYPGYPLYQVTITAILPNITVFRICDSDVCNISITDRMITSQTEPSDKNVCKRNWFGSVYSNSDNGIKSVRLTFVAVRVDNKLGKLKYIRIGRIGESEKPRLEQMLPANMLNFKTRTIVTLTRSFNYYELDLPALLTTDIADSNYCAIDISYDERHPNVVFISDQRIIENHITPQWFIPIAQRLSPPKVYETTQQIISQNKKEETNMTTVSLERCIINDNATVLFWNDGTKTVTKTTPGDVFDPEVGIAMGIAKRLFGSKAKFDKYVNAVVSDMYKRNAAAFTEKELLDALAENEKIITKAKAKHKAEKEAFLAAKNDPNHEGKLPELHSLKGDHFYRFAKIRKDIIMAEIEKRKEQKAAKAKAKAAKAKKKNDK